MNRTVRTTGLALATIAALSNAGPSAARADASPAPATIATGTLMPMKDVALPCVDGKSVSIGAAAGKKGTLVLFICNHCPFVKAWQGRIADIGNAAPANGIGVIAISSNDPNAIPEDSFAAMKVTARQAKYKFPYVIDETADVARAFGAMHTPEAFLFGADGRLVYHGAIDDNGKDYRRVKKHWLADAVTAVQNGQPVAVAETKALGCGIHGRPKTQAN